MFKKFRLNLKEGHFVVNERSLITVFLKSSKNVVIKLRVKSKGKTYILQSTRQKQSY